MIKQEANNPRKLFAFLQNGEGRCAPDDAGGGEFGSDLHRWLVIDKIAVDHGLAIAVGKDRRPEDLRGMQGWRGGKADLHRIEVVEHAAILRDVVVVAAETQLRVGQLAVE